MSEPVSSATVPPFGDVVDSLDDLPPVLDQSFQIKSIDVREKALPIRPGDLTRLLLGQPGLSPEEQDGLGRLGILLGAVFHSEFYERIRELKELYGPLDPDSDYVKIANCSRVRTEASDEEFLPPFESTMHRANYRRLDVKVIQDAVEAPNELGLTYQPNFGQFEHLRVYVRGYTKIPRVFRSLRTRFRKRTVWLDAYQRMVVAAQVQARPEARPVRPVGRGLPPDVQGRPARRHGDAPPEQGTKVKMRWIDKAQIASPMVMGVPTLIYKLTVATLINPLLLIPILIAPITAGMNSFFGFQRAKHKHLSSMIRNLYYLTLANNSSVLTRIIDSAEEEEYKEAMLAYFFLWRAAAQGRKPTGKELDAEIEAFLLDVSGVEINFEFGDAIGKLFRLGLADRDDERPPPGPPDRPGAWSSSTSGGTTPSFMPDRRRPTPALDAAPSVREDLSRRVQSNDPPVSS